jgi:hypothetical protein
MRLKSLLTVLSIACFALATPAFADLSISASGAGDLPSSAEDLTPFGVTEIVGMLNDTSDINMFKLNIVDASRFSAMTLGVPFGIPDTELFLFNSLGQAVYMNDDIGGPSGSTLSCLPSAVDNPCSTPAGGLGPLSAGTYYLAIAWAQVLPQDSGGSYLFTYLQDASSLDSTGVYGSNGAGPIAQWDTSGAVTSPNFDLKAYDIVLTGTTLPAPEPATGLLLVAGLAVGWVIWRKRFVRTKLN